MSTDRGRNTEGRMPISEDVALWKRRAASFNQSAKRAGRTEKVTWQEIQAEFKMRQPMSEMCCWCYQPLTVDTLSLDHLHALAKGGEHSLRNMAFSCRKCNRYKGSMTGEDYKNLLEALRKVGLLTLFFRQYEPRRYRS